MRTLYPRAVFAKGESPIVLGPQDVTFAVKTAGAAPVIQLDESTGNLTALRAGHALIQTGFAGAKLDTCVVVMANATEGATSNCEELRSSQPAATPVESSAKM